MTTFVFLALVTFPAVFSGTVPFHPLSDEYIDHINSLQTTWKAGRNFDKDTSMSDLVQLLGVLEDENAPSLERIHHVKDEDEVIPESFDAREAWPSCESIRTIRDQSKCRSSWAVAATSAMSDRICIASNGTDQTLVSAEDIIACCWICGSGCDGGYPIRAWMRWYEKGVVSGGPYNTTTGCRAYSLPPCEHHDSPGDLPKCDSLNIDPPQCLNTCDDGFTSLSYNESKSFASLVYLVGAEDDEPDPEQIQLEIMKNGPVGATFNVYSDFFSYTSGVYQNTTEEYLGDHSVRIIGWGIENGTSYWLVTNSWNENWGDNGLFKILRGEDNCGIEKIVLAGTPKE